MSTSFYRNLSTYFAFEDLAECVELALFHMVAMVIIRIRPGGDFGFESYDVLRS
jgi:hypothetical protein